MLPWEPQNNLANKTSPIALFMIYNNKELQRKHPECWSGYYLYQEHYQSNKSLDNKCTMNLCGIFNVVSINETITQFLPFGDPNSLQTLPANYYTDYYGLIVPPFLPVCRNTFYLHTVSSNWNEMVPKIGKFVTKFKQNLQNLKSNKKTTVDVEMKLEEENEEEKQEQFVPMEDVSTLPINLDNTNRKWEHKQFYEHIEIEKFK